MPHTASDYPLIADHGLIGDLQTSALVATDGTIDWFCAPRFDSPSIFGALLDHGRGGHFRVRPTDDGVTTKQLYFPDTAVLVTRFLTETGVGEVVDFMPVSDPTTATDRHRIVRLLRCVRGRMAFDIEVAPRFDYGRERHHTRLLDQGIVFEGRTTTMTLSLVRQQGDERVGQPDIDAEGDVHAHVELTAGQMRGVVIETGTGVPARQVRLEEVRGLFDETVHYWESWLSQSTYEGRWRETLNRSAITLKLMTYAPTGGLVAAPTAGLPEQVGGERNWDYRYTWVRDASFSVYALLGLGFTDEAVALGHWLGDRVDEQAHTRRRRRGGPAEHHVPRRRLQRPQRGGPRPLGGLPRLVPGADRQRRLGPAAARHLRGGHRQHLLRGPAGSAGRPPGVAEAVAGHRLGQRRTGTSRRRASGRPGAAGRTSPTDG